MSLQVRGNLRKMVTRLGPPVEYLLRLGEQEVELNEYIGREISLNYCGEIHCVHCGRKSSKSFGQGYCYPCFRDLPECDSCIVKPETCHYDAGTCRDPAWGLKNCFQDHYVYLANSSGIKVGITRGSQIPTRWMDQGATQALPIARVKNRLQSGLVEVALKQHVADRTDWRKMLKGASEQVTLAQVRDELLAQCASEIEGLQRRFGADAIVLLGDAVEQPIEYPVVDYPAKITSLSFDKTERVVGRLEGIKGQYLMLDTGVINIRKFGGYMVEFTEVVS